MGEDRRLGGDRGDPGWQALAAGRWEVARRSFERLLATDGASRLGGPELGGLVARLRRRRLGARERAHRYEYLLVVARTPA